MNSDNKKIDSEKEISLADDLSVVEGELLELSDEDVVKIDDEVRTKVSSKKDNEIGFPQTEKRESKTENQTYYLQYIVLPFTFLTVTLLGGLRVGAENGDVLFYKPALVCLIFGAILLVLFFRANLLELGGWLNERFSTAKNIANGLLLFTIWTASTQVFNSLIPEQGLPFWIVSFCFLWTLWTNLFADFDTKRLLQSLGGLFGLAFAVKYLILINLVPETSQSWLDILSLKNVTQETFAYLLDLPNFAGGTGYIQFFMLAFYLIGLFLLKPRTE